VGRTIAVFFLWVGVEQTMNVFRKKLFEVEKETKKARVGVQEEVDVVMRIRSLADHMQRRERTESNRDYVMQALVEVLVEQNVSLRSRVDFLCSVVDAVIEELPDDARRRADQGRRAPEMGEARDVAYR
jgi:hypothetical protein